MTNDQKKLLLEKLKDSKDAHAFFSSQFDKDSAKKSLTSLKTLLDKNPDATIVLIR